MLFKIKDKERALQILSDRNSKVLQKDFSNEVVRLNVEVAKLYAERFGLDEKLVEMLDNKEIILSILKSNISGSHLIDTILERMRSGLMYGNYMHDSDFVKSMIKVNPTIIDSLSNFTGLGYSQKDIIDYANLAIDLNMVDVSKYSKEQLQNDKVALRLIKHNGNAYLDENISADLKNRENVLEIALSDYTANKREIFLEYLNLGNYKNYKVIAKYVTIYSTLLHILPDNYMSNMGNIKELIECGLPIYYLGEEYQNDRELVLLAVKVNPIAVREITSYLMDNEMFVLDLLQVTITNVLKYTSTRLLNDEYFLREAIKRAPKIENELNQRLESVLKEKNKINKENIENNPKKKSIRTLKNGLKESLSKLKKIQENEYEA